MGRHAPRGLVLSSAALVAAATLVSACAGADTGAVSDAPVPPLTSAQVAQKLAAADLVCDDDETFTLMDDGHSELYCRVSGLPVLVTVYPTAQALRAANEGGCADGQESIYPVVYGTNWSAVVSSTALAGRTAGALDGEVQSMRAFCGASFGASASAFAAQGVDHACATVADWKTSLEDDLDTFRGLNDPGTDPQFFSDMTFMMAATYELLASSAPLDMSTWPEGFANPSQDVAGALNAIAVTLKDTPEDEVTVVSMMVSTIGWLEELEGRCPAAAAGSASPKGG